MNPIHWITRYLPWLLVLSLFILLAGCGDDDEGSTHTPQPALGSSDINKIYAHHRAAFSGCASCHDGSLEEGKSFIDLSSANGVNDLVGNYQNDYEALISVNCGHKYPYVKQGNPNLSVLLATAVIEFSDMFNDCDTAYGLHESAHRSTWDNEPGLIADLESWIEKGL